MSKEWLGEQGIELLAVGAGNLRGFVNSKHTIKTVSDLRDLKVRTYQDPVVTEFWSGVCNASPLPMSEVFTGLQTKAIDGLEFAGTSVVGQKFYEVAKYYSDIDWQWCSSANFQVSRKAWEELPEDLQRLVEECAIEAMAFQSETEIKDVEKAKEALEEQGVEYYELSDAERQTFIDYARTTDEFVREFVGAEVFDAMFKAVEDYRSSK